MSLSSLLKDLVVYQKCARHSSKLVKKKEKKKYHSNNDRKKVSIGSYDCCEIHVKISDLVLENYPTLCECLKRPGVWSMWSDDTCLEVAQTHNMRN
ncbi:hypothetical protein [Gardnerella sp. Marseille-QA0894]|uniref:hypothetical protein n=1 Tax=Gardnerella sp. Marseille-QA0894 TaxID=3383031 RepID=UPI003AF7237C